MTVLALTSAKGSPGVTTLALRLAEALARPIDPTFLGATPRNVPVRGDHGDPGRRPVVLVEADPSGGDLAARRGLAGAPGLASLALSARRSLGPESVLAHCQRIGRVHVLAGVAGSRQGTVVRPVVPRLVEALREIDAVVLVDAGRLGPVGEDGEPLLLRGADLVALVSRTAAECVVHARSAVDALRAAGVGCELVLVGRPEFPATAIAAAVGAPVLGVVVDSPAEAAAEPGALLRGRRGDLARSVEALARLVAERLATPAQSPGRAAQVVAGEPEPARAAGNRQVVPLRALRSRAASPVAPA